MYSLLGTHTLKDIRIPNNVKTIEKYAFCGSGIEHVELPEYLTTIGDYAFCESALQRVEIPYSVIEIKKGRFKDVSI